MKELFAESGWSFGRGSGILVPPFAIYGDDACGSADFDCAMTWLDTASAAVPNYLQRALDRSSAGAIPTGGYYAPRWKYRARAPLPLTAAPPARATSGSSSCSTRARRLPTLAHPRRSIAIRLPRSCISRHFHAAYLPGAAERDAGGA